MYFFLNFTSQIFYSKIRLILLSLLIIAFSSCSKERLYINVEEDVITETIEPYFENNPLPEGQNKLRVLAIGNSYTTDGTQYVGEILDGLDVDPNNYCLYMAVLSAASLQRWVSVLKQREKVELLWRAGYMSIDRTTGTLEQILSQDWDVVVLQQVSYDAIDYNTYNPSLHTLIDAVLNYCTNRKVSIALQMPHAYATSSPNNYGLIGEKRWNCLNISTQKAVVYDGLNIVIPTGTAIENARHSSLQTPLELTRDGIHLNHGTGRYVAACVWVQILFDPVFNTHQWHSTALHQLADWELTGRDEEAMFVPGTGVSVTEENRALCQICAYLACVNPFHINYDVEGWMKDNY